MSKQTEAQRLAGILVGRPMQEHCDKAAALLLRQDELLKQALEALDYIVGTSSPMTSQQEQCWPSMKSAITAIRAHLEAK